MPTAPQKSHLRLKVFIKTIMMMTLKQAFASWSMTQENMALAAKSRDAVQKILLKKYGDIDLEQVTETFARRLFSRCKKRQELKAKAASVLVNLLSWGCDHDYCQHPTFDYSVCNSDKKAQSETNKETKTEKAMEEKTTQDVSILSRRPVAQIDPKTLQVIQVWPSVFRAHSELNIKNIERAIQRHGIAGGFFWADENEAPSFKPAIRGKRMVLERKSKRSIVQIDPGTLQVIRVWPSAFRAHKELNIPNIARAIQRHGIAGGYFWAYENEASTFKPVKSGEQKSLERKTKQKALATASRNTGSDRIPAQPEEVGAAESDAREASELMAFTDQQLIDELIRRGWHGKLKIYKEIEL